MHAQSSTRTHPRRLPLAARYAYSFGLYTLEAADLAQIGCLEALEAMQRGIAPTGNKARYLVGIARFAMLRYCGQHRTGITTPRKARGYYEPLTVASLDAPLSDDSDQTLLDVLAAEEEPDEDDESCSQDGYNATYDIYLDSLPL